MQKSYFYACQTTFSLRFFIDTAKEMETNDVFLFLFFLGETAIKKVQLIP